MELNKVIELFDNNKNIQKWNKTERENTIIYYFNNTTIKLNQQIANNIETALPYYVDEQEIIAKINDVEKDINTILSRDWEQQEYRRGVVMGTFEPEDWGTYAHAERYIKKYDPLGFIYKVGATKPDLYDIAGRLAKAKSEVIIYSYCSLDKNTLNNINDLSDDCVGIHAYVSSSKAFSYEHWTGKGFYKTKKE